MYCLDDRIQKALGGCEVMLGNRTVPVDSIIGRSVLWNGTMWLGDALVVLAEGKSIIGVEEILRSPERLEHYMERGRLAKEGQLQLCAPSMDAFRMPTLHPCAGGFNFIAGAIGSNY